MENVVAAATRATRKAVNAFATDAFTTSGASGLYDRARPTYPLEAVSKLLSVVAGKEDVRIVEVGAGTGIFTQCLVKAPNASTFIAQITAVEPASGMREAFSKNAIFENQPGRKPQVEIVDGSFAEIPVATGSADIVVGAQCFHWSHPDYSSSVAEFARILKPGSTLAFIWNLESRNSARWVSQVRDVYEVYEQGQPQYHHGWWKAMFETSAYKDNFQKAESFDFRINHPTTEQGVIDRVLSKSYIGVQTPEEQEKISRKLQNILQTGQDRVWIDAKEGIFEYPYETNLYVMKRL